MGIEFDDQGAVGELRIDFEALTQHLAELKRAGRKRQVGITNVIFDPKLRMRLTRTRAWSQIADLPFSTRPAWIRHDGHYHLDFQLPCRRLATLPP